MTELLKALLSVQSDTGACDDMQAFLLAFAANNKLNVREDLAGNIYMIKGASQTYPCAVAHMDTVHRITKGGIEPVVVNGLVTGMNPLTMEQTGIGGDDKCGIYAALICLQTLPEMKAAFFVDEECGCDGSNNCDLEFFKDCRYILQADRRGKEDWVKDISGPLGSKAFQKAVRPIYQKYGYKPCSGMMTDVMELRDRKVGVSVANMSAGYYSPHMDCEFISLKSLDNVINMMVDIFTNVTDVFPFVTNRSSYNWRRATTFAAGEHDGSWTKDGSGQWSKKYPALDNTKRIKNLGDTDDSKFEEEMRRELIEEQGISQLDMTTPCEVKCTECGDILPTDDMVQISNNCSVCHECYDKYFGDIKPGVTS